MSASLPSNPPGRNQPVSIDQLVVLLAPALGKEKSRELVGSHASALGHAIDRLNLIQAMEILTALGDQPGIVGVSARFAKTRLVTPQRSQSKAVSVQRSVAPAEEPEASSVKRPEPVSISAEELIELLAHSLGTEKSKEAVEGALSQLGFTQKRLSPTQAHAVLESLAKAGGVVGVTARFANARLLLRLRQK